MSGLAGGSRHSCTLAGCRALQVFSWGWGRGEPGRAAQPPEPLVKGHPRSLTREAPWMLDLTLVAAGLCRSCGEAGRSRRAGLGRASGCTAGPWKL